VGHPLRGCFFRPLRGLAWCRIAIPRLASWAAFFRRFAANSTKCAGEYVVAGMIRATDKNVDGLLFEVCGFGDVCSGVPSGTRWFNAAVFPPVNWRAIVSCAFGTRRFRACARADDSFRLRHWGGSWGALVDVPASLRDGCIWAGAHLFGSRHAFLGGMNKLRSVLLTLSHRTRKDRCCPNRTGLWR